MSGSIKVAKELLRLAKEVVAVEQLEPVDGKKSFHDKAYVDVDKFGHETLYSYGAPVMRKDSDGSYVFYSGPNHLSDTTLRHIKAWTGMNKAQVVELPFEFYYEYERRGGTEMPEDN